MAARRKPLNDGVLWAPVARGVSRGSGAAAADEPTEKRRVWRVEVMFEKVAKQSGFYFY